MAENNWANFEDLPIDESFKYGTRYGISDEFGSEKMRMSVIQFDPGERGPLHYHNPPTEEYYIVMEGQLDISMDGEILEADEGTIILTSPETEHFPENNTDEPAILLCVSAPNIDPSSESGITIVEDAD